MPPQTIEEIIARLERIIDDALRGRQRIGYFAALYERVTANVRHALIAGNVFDDGPRMERLDVVFANRFLEAWDRHVAGQKPTDSWAVAFDHLDDPGPLVVQHLMLLLAHRPSLVVLHQSLHLISQACSSRLLRMAAAAEAVV